MFSTIINYLIPIKQINFQDRKFSTFNSPSCLFCDKQLLYSNIYHEFYCKTNHDGSLVKYSLSYLDNSLRTINIFDKKNKNYYNFHKDQIPNQITRIKLDYNNTIHYNIPHGVFRVFKDDFKKNNNSFSEFTNLLKEFVIYNQHNYASNI